ncbi:MAG: hypothetical protein JHC93_04730 [Parachlamydiales bacterium]|nr:hypothetical protein [Parachlamydiales bacterium]
MIKLIRSVEVDRVKEAAIVTGVTIGALIIGPFVSAIALSILGPSYLVHKYQERKLKDYKFSLQNQKYSPYGREEYQDFRTWNGKLCTDTKSINQVCPDKLGQAYIHGRIHKIAKDKFSESRMAFNNEEDLKWLKATYKWKKNEVLKNKELATIILFAKLLIPVVGVYWALFATHYHKTKHCEKCIESLGKRWNWKEAIKFHHNTLALKLDKQPL